MEQLFGFPEFYPRNSARESRAVFRAWSRGVSHLVKLTVSIVYRFNNHLKLKIPNLDAQGNGSMDYIKQITLLHKE